MSASSNALMSGTGHSIGAGCCIGSVRSGRVRGGGDRGNDPVAGCRNAHGNPWEYREAGIIPIANSGAFSHNQQSIPSFIRFAIRSILRFRALAICCAMLVIVSIERFPSNHMIKAARRRSMSGETFRCRCTRRSLTAIRLGGDFGGRWSHGSSFMTATRNAIGRSDAEQIIRKSGP
jgi:hypothetical protein